jgi:hydroxymethylglutaryl-CoA lyase
MYNSQSGRVHLVECPRDAMQGIHPWIPTEDKIRYLNALLQVGFDTLDFGSFVNPKMVPQMRDSRAVLEGLNREGSGTQLLAIVANERGAHEAASLDGITYLGYPFSISETFQKRNTNKTIAASIAFVDALMDTCARHDKTPVIYLSMGFGNPYGEPWSISLLEDWAARMAEKGIGIISLSDTIGTSKPEDIQAVFSSLTSAFPNISFGAHLHTTPNAWHEKVEAAYTAGCRRFDSAIKGFGGCPMAKDDLTGNMPTEKVLSYLTAKKQTNHLNMLAFESAYNIALQIFPHS